MNICSLCVLVCVFGSAATGVIVGVEHGAVAAVCGGLIGTAIGIAAAFGVVWLERASIPVKGRKQYLPFAVATSLSLIAPFASFTLTVVASQKLLQLFIHST